jgi:hypothetical protein
MNDYFEGDSDYCVCDDYTSKVNSNLGLHSSWMLRSVSCYFVTNVTVQPVNPIFRIKQSKNNSSRNTSRLFRSLHSSHVLVSNNMIYISLSR